MLKHFVYGIKLTPCARVSLTFLFIRFPSNQTGTHGILWRMIDWRYVNAHTNDIIRFHLRYISNVIHSISHSQWQCPLVDGETTSMRMRTRTRHFSRDAHFGNGKSGHSIISLSWKSLKCIQLNQFILRRCDIDIIRNTHQHTGRGESFIRNRFSLKCTQKVEFKYASLNLTCSHINRSIIQPCTGRLPISKFQIVGITYLTYFEASELFRFA